MDGELPEPIEIELTSHEPRAERAGRWRRDDDPPDPPDRTTESVDDGAPESPRTDGSERIRLVVTAAVVGVLALALGWLVGRSSGGDDGLAVDDPPTTGAPTTVPLPFETLPIDGEAIDPGEFGDDAAEPSTSSTVARRTTTTTEVLGPTTEPVAVDPRLNGVPVDLIGVEIGGVLVEADVASGTLTDFRAGRIASDGGALIVGPDWVVVGGGGGSRVIRSDGRDARVDVGEPWQPLHLPGTELFWRTSDDEPVEGGAVLTLVDLDGEPVGPTLELLVNTWPYLVDPASGGVIVSNMPRSYAITPDGVEYLGSGEIVGISERQLVTFDCDEAFVCSLYVTDRATGEVTIVPADPSLEESYRWQSSYGWGGSSSGTLSPDGRWVAVVGSSWRSTVAGIVDVQTGRFVQLSRDSYASSVVWSPDSRYAFALADQVVVAYDTVADEQFPVFVDTVRWTQLGVRPVVPSTDPATSLPRPPEPAPPAGSAPAEKAVEG